MITLAVISAVLGIFATIAVLVFIRIWTPATKMQDVLWWGRLPGWVAWFGFPMSLLGLIVWTIGIAVGSKGMRKFGAYLSVWSITGLATGWLGGVIGSYALQFFTGWQPPPPAVMPPAK